MVKRAIKALKINYLTNLEYFCIDISALLTRLGNWAKRKRWEIE
jgi:hypothetical protein